MNQEQEQVEVKIDEESAAVQETAEEVTEEKKSPEAPPANTEFTPQELESFMQQTYSEVSSMRIEMSALISALLKRGLLSQQEMEDAYQATVKAYNDSMAEAMKQAGQPPIEEQRKANIDAECGIDMNPEPEAGCDACDTGCEAGRKPPTGHGG